MGIKKITLNELRSLVVEIIKENENLSVDPRKVHGGTGAREGYTLIAQDGLKQILELSRKNPSNVFFVRDDNYTNFGPYYVKNGKVAKYTVANSNYDFAKNPVRSLKIPKDVILKFTIVEGLGPDKKIIKESWIGVDADLETSLFEYGFVAKQRNDKDYPDEWFVLYDTGNGAFDTGHIREIELDNIVLGKEWASEDDISSFLDFVGSDKEEWVGLDFKNKLSDLLSYWGADNIIGSSYGGFSKEEAEKMLMSESIKPKTQKIKLSEVRQLVKNIIMERIWSDDDSKPDDYNNIIIYSKRKVNPRGLYTDHFPKNFGRIIDEFDNIINKFLDNNNLEEIPLHPYNDEFYKYLLPIINFDKNGGFLDYTDYNPSEIEFLFGGNTYKIKNLDENDEDENGQKFMVLVRNFVGKYKKEISKVHKIFGYMGKPNIHIEIISNTSDGLQGYVANKLFYNFNGHITQVENHDLGHSKLSTIFRMSPIREIEESVNKSVNKNIRNIIKEGSEDFDLKKGEKIKIDMGNGRGVEEVTVMDNFNAGTSSKKFITLKVTDKPTEYTVAISRLKNIIKEDMGNDFNRKKR